MRFGGQQVLRFLLILGGILLLGRISPGRETFNFEDLSYCLIAANLQGIEVRDGYAYCADGFGLSIWSLDDLENPEEVGWCPTSGDALKIALYEDYAYIAEPGVGIAIIDIQSPEHPRYLRELDVVQEDWHGPWDVSVQDGLLLVSNRYDGMVIASLDDPANPEILFQGMFPNADYTQLILKDQYLFIRDGRRQAILVVDVSDMQHPILETEIEESGICILIEGNILISATTDTLRFFNIENPSTPVRIGSSRSFRVSKVVTNGEYVFSSGDARIWSFDARNLENVRLLDAVQVAGISNDIAFVDDMIFCAGCLNGMTIVSTQSPPNLEVVGGMQRVYHNRCVEVTGETAFLLDDLVGLKIYDVSDPEAPQQISTLNIHPPRLGGVPGNDLLLQDDLLYMKNYDSICVVDFGDLNDPQVIGGMYLNAGELKMDIVDHYLYISGIIERGAQGRINGNLIVIDIEDLENWRTVFTANDAEWPNNTYYGVVAGGYFFQQVSDPHGAGGIREVLVYSLENPAHPELVGRWPRDSYDLLIAYDEYLYCSYSNGDFVTYDIEDPLHPEELNTLRIDAEYSLIPHNYFIDENGVLYLHNYWDGLMALSLDDPVRPELIGYLKTPGSIYDVKAQNNLLYVADENNFGIYRFTGDINGGGDDNQYRVALAEGWSLVSAPLIPDNHEITTVFQPVQASLLMAKDYQGHFYVPEIFNNIPFWNYLEGYQVKMSVARNLAISGEYIPEDTSIPVSHGWYIAPYYPVQSVDATIAFTNIEEHLIIAKNVSGQFYAPAYNFSNMDDLQRGKAYQICVNADVDLVWNIEDERLARSEPLSLIHTHFTPSHPTGNNMSMLITGLPEGSEVGALREDGVCVGAGYTLKDGRCGLAIWGDDPVTPEKEGAFEGEVLTFRLWDGATETPIILVWIEGKNSYVMDGFAFAKSLVQIVVPTNYFLSEAFPNPFNSTTTIGYSLPASGMVSLAVYDLSGRDVARLADGVKAAGTHEAVWTADGIASGVYVVKLTAGEKTKMNKVVLVR